MFDRKKYESYWHKLNINIDTALRPEILDLIQNENYPDAKHYHFCNVDDFLNGDWHQRLWDNTGVSFNAGLLFFRNNYVADNFAHQDYGVCASINWCIGSDNRPMQWWNTDTPGYRTPDKTSGYYYKYLLDDIGPPIDQHIIGNHPTLIRIDVPHLISRGPGSRVCISLRIENDPTWEQAVDQLLNLFV